jgi:menaquinol-cytochrome c reductase iron-sulfur subunit
MSFVNENRRGFFLQCIYGLWSLMGAALTLPAAAYLLLPPRLKKGTDWVEVGDLGQWKQHDPDEVVFRRNRVDGWKITSEKTTAWVVKVSDKEVVAFAPQCTHLGCAYHWDEQKQNFLCPCHTSTFGLDGKVLSGPAPRPLDRYQAKLNGSKLMLGQIEKSEDAG